jgi:plasmid stabilization system protein ParE
MGELIYHPLIQRDLNEILTYYEDKDGSKLADRFFQEFVQLSGEAVESPDTFHFDIHSKLKRANFRNFPYHFLFRKTASGIRVLILRHDSRHPSVGLRRI